MYQEEALSPKQVEPCMQAHKIFLDMQVATCSSLPAPGTGLYNSLELEHSNVFSTVLLLPACLLLFAGLVCVQSVPGEFCILISIP